MSTVYDVLHTSPRLKKLDRGREGLARALVASGKLRIDAGADANFARLIIGAENVNVTFTAREIANPNLLFPARRELLKCFEQKLKDDIKKRHGVSEEIELQLARALVQCNAAPVITLLCWERAEIYISFGHAVGDVMDVAAWQMEGSNSGMQAAGENAVYVSCGGNPFLEEKEHIHTGDGEPALARFMIIAAQETGHNADIIRNEKGNHVGRFSADLSMRAPSPKAREARACDMAKLDQVYNRAQNLGLNRLAEWERQLKFYRDLKVRHWRRTLAWLASRTGWQVFRLLLAREKLGALTTIRRHPYRAMMLKVFFHDMRYNLEPTAGAYRRADANEQEAVACAEALARVPQQVVKWGAAAVQLCQPRLYALYYNEVVPACAAACERFRQR